ncbi:GreA/GreB family elongation factor [Bacillus toyonensis]|uniref:GreA/GreB family elongation factor n=1 Tax=Bacillus toyonensis TaxID=155322 RepID=UPI002E231BE5|nr:GreA/GreB family elongation factor [Bacillus toyonensis]MED2737589.1 GreA/GreB family elongation factor [Bacillus toyonensis]
MAEMKVRLTQVQYDNLVARRKTIQEEEMPRVAELIDIARDFGDLSENAEFDAAKDEQGQLNAELLEIERKLRFATIIKHSGNVDNVDVGHTITIKSINGDDTSYTFTLIGEDGDGINEIDVLSKLGSNLLGKSVGDIVSYEANNDPTLGILKFEVLKIQ